MARHRGSMGTVRNLESSFLFLSLSFCFLSIIALWFLGLFFLASCCLTIFVLHLGLAESAWQAPVPQQAPAVGLAAPKRMHTQGLVHLRVCEDGVQVKGHGTRHGSRWSRLPGSQPGMPRLLSSASHAYVAASLSICSSHGDVRPTCWTLAYHDRRIAQSG